MVPRLRECDFLFILLFLSFWTSSVDSIQATSPEGPERTSRMGLDRVGGECPCLIVARGSRDLDKENELHKRALVSLLGVVDTVPSRREIKGANGAFGRKQHPSHL